MEDRPQVIIEKLKLLKRLDTEYKIFGASSHKYITNRVSEKEIANFEHKHSIILPDEFKSFLFHIGYGAGPDYGIYSLSEMETEFEDFRDCLSPTISNLYSACELSDGDAEALIDKKKKSPREYFYKKLHSCNGILPIQTQGCTYYSCFVLNGEQNGKIWYLDTNEFEVLPGGITREISFFEWYENWLDNSIKQLKP